MRMGSPRTAIEEKAPEPRFRWERLRGALSPAEWTRLGLMAIVVVAFFVAGFAMIFAAAQHHYRLSRTAVFGVGTGILALTLGMRHAFDADHISAIDNTTRKLMADGKRPLSIGFFFSLGHSTVVFVMTILLNIGIRSLDAQVKNGNSTFHGIGNLVGTVVSGTFLYVIAALNLVILVSIVRVFFQLRQGLFDEQELEEQLDKRGMMNRFFGGLSRRIDQPWKIYPIGVLFGLGFDTATEVALLVISGSAVASGLPPYAILSLPILFAAGMSLFDTLDGCFMNFAYGWAFSRPIRKVFYNIVITGLSVVAAFLIGTVEVLGLLDDELHFRGRLWADLSRFNINTAGFFIVGLFALTWLVASVVWRFGKVEERWDNAALRRAREQVSPTIGGLLVPTGAEEAATGTLGQ